METSESLEPDFGTMGEKTMNEMYTEAPRGVGKAIREGEHIADFLPPPDQLVRKAPPPPAPPRHVAVPLTPAPYAHRLRA
jgi:hypothetical protein